MPAVAVIAMAVADQRYQPMLTGQYSLANVHAVAAIAPAVIALAVSRTLAIVHWPLLASYCVPTNEAHGLELRRRQTNT